MKVFLTGVDGYIGCVLAPMLLEQGIEVVALDTGYYRDGWLYSDPSRISKTPLTMIKDLRRVSEEDLTGCDAVVHLAELSNDPLGENNPAITHEINHQGSVALAKHARAAGVERFVYTSSCSVYGLGSGEFLDETSAVNPQTAYAECKVLVEKDVAELATDNFSPVFLRNATAYGASPRMRFDIVLNNLSGLAWTTGRIVMISDGTPWRPIVHVEDICRAIICALQAPREAIHQQVFNVGSTDANYQIREIAEIVADVFPGCELEIGPSGGDNRSYRVNCDKIRDGLPGFTCEWTPETGARQLLSVFERIDMSQATFDFRAFTRLKQLTYLQKTLQLDDSFYWKSGASAA
jgi:nucleoside-diphosphate-sugar epimerase